VGEIGNGLCVLVGVTHDDTVAHADKLADKIWNLRVFDDADGVMNRSLADVFNDARGASQQVPGGRAQVLVVSQFTLYGDTRKGRRPSWVDAARPEHAEPLVERVVDRLRTLGANVATGRFRTEMRVTIVNDGPVTLMLEV
jgi:D-tyrosyl-tRNA(Tyr) deacylase